ncbi:MAG: TlpA family protein disulfide reductase [Bacteroidetes bacterium]|nr:TlpA family protein disulfide reductase [Bacteroidota bacterium]
MNNVISFTKQTLLIAFFTVFFFCVNGQNNKDQFPDPKIKAGIAKISGSISNLKLSKEEKKVIIAVWVSNPVTAEESKYETNLNKNNQFSINIPLECSTAICGFTVVTETNSYGACIIGLEQDKKLQMNIVFDDKGDIKIDVKEGLNLTFNDMMNLLKARERFEDLYNWGDFHKMTPKEFAEYELTINLKKRINSTIDSLILAKKSKKHLTNEFNLEYLSGPLFSYKEMAERSFKNRKKENLQSTAYTAIEPDKSYYSFLRQFNLNNPQYLYCYFYAKFMRRFLSIAAFKIPEIKNQPIDEWLRGVKATVQDMVGFNSGLFYDMLAASAYARQFNDERNPLTNKQVENIKKYYKNRNEEIAKILLKKNEEIIKIVESNNDLKVNATPAVAKEKLIDTIIAKYKGRVVLVDFWATWCGPCVKTMENMKPLKAELKDKGVVFVYLSNSSSPKPLWEGKIKAIGGEQYYFKADEWEYVMNSFGFESIPSYLIYDKNGILKHKFTSYPSTDKMRKMIEELLP